jgi:hypothetical protein
MSGAPGSNSTFLSPGGPYFVSPAGTIQRQSSPVLAAGLWTAGWAGFPTMAAAKAFASGLTLNPAAAAAKAAGSAAGSVASDVLKPLFQSAIWLRVAEVVAGLILLGIGLNAMLKGKPLSAVTGTAGKLGKVAMF